jgi:hypothetical protein
MKQIDWLSRLLDIIPVSGTKSESSERRAERVRIEVSCWHETDMPGQSDDVC